MEGEEQVRKDTRKKLYTRREFLEKFLWFILGGVISTSSGFLSKLVKKLKELSEYENPKKNPESIINNPEISKLLNNSKFLEFLRNNPKYYDFVIYISFRSIDDLSQDPEFQEFLKNNPDYYKLLNIFLKSTPAPSPTPTYTPTIPPTHTPTPTSTPTSTPTPSPTPTSTATPRPTPTYTSTPKPTPPSEATPKPTPTFPTLSTPETRITTQVLYRGPRGTKKVAITFDDSANPEILRSLLNFCQEKKIKMVWFVIGRTMNEESAEIIKEGLKSGLIKIGNHSQNHYIGEFSKLNEEYIENEKNSWIKTMMNWGIAEKHLRIYFRPPGGAGGYRGGDKRLLNVLNKNGYQYLTMWDIEFIYTTRVKQAPYTREVLKQIAKERIITTEGGNIVLAHFNKVDVEAIKDLVEELIQEGYQFVFPEELFQNP